MNNIEDAAKHLINITGFQTNFAQCDKSMFDKYNLTAEIINELLSKIISVSFEELTKAYVKYFSLSEITQIIKFYESPIGGKFLNLQNTISDEVKQNIDHSQIIRISVIKALSEQP